MAYMWVMKGPLTLRLESPFRGQSQETSGLVNVAADECPSQNYSKCAPHYPRGENCQRRGRILFLWEAEGSVWKTSLFPHTSRALESLFGSPRRGSGKWLCGRWSPPAQWPWSVRRQAWPWAQLLPTRRKHKWFPKNKEVTNPRMLALERTWNSGKPVAVLRVTKWLERLRATKLSAGIRTCLVAQCWYHDTSPVTQIKKAFLGSLPWWLCQHSLSWLDFGFKTAQVMKSYLSLHKEHFWFF